MVWKRLRVTTMLAVLVAACTVVLGDWQQAEAAGRRRRSPDLFYNYYVPPGPSGGPGAQLYVAPLPTPPLVGHTYYTYQPLMPHEWLYPHCRIYYRRNPGAGWTRTMVILD
jgi:hypothetical protein